MEDRKGIIFILFFFLLILLSPRDTEVIQQYKTDGIAEISCSSDSMGLSIPCDNKVRFHYVQEKEKLIPGDVYVYAPYYNNYSSIIHRLIGCIQVDGKTIRENCEYWTSYLIFKGDNNAIMDQPIQYTNEIELRHVDALVN